MESPVFIVYYNLGLGGLQKKIVDIINYLGKEKPTVPVYLLLRRKKKDFDIGWQIRNSQTKIYYYHDWSPIKIPLFFPVFVFWKTLRFKPKTILAFSDIPSLSAIWTKMILFWRDIVVVANERAYTSWYVSNERLGRIRNVLIKLFYPFADVITCLSEITKKDLIDFYNFPPGKIKIIPNWTSFAGEKPKTARKNFDLIFIGRLTETKGIPFLLSTFLKIKKKQKNIKLCILGDGEEKEKILNFIKKNNLEHNIIFKGAQYDVISYLCRSKILVFTSDNNIEGFPTSILEAMSMKIPVLAKRFTGLEEVLEDGKNGFIFDTAEEFVNKILSLLDDRRERQKVSLRAKVYVEKYHSLNNIHRYLKIAGI